ncbi:hypothetical protein [Allosphingosinicella indica]|uniref:Uncharacterized protein n=1 Tax=Allosphingosinicella indica TaxID=941907 RepID=A0A1X7FYE1_9SPHN|nr:hypothetical protein [Allosphingosinicella indica]SMF61121.1 hypothetical protein SAMN06295910_0132 [Allosphingosinicella indica]
MHVRLYIVIYASLFALLALADLTSSLLGHWLAGATEFNPALAVSGRIDVERFVGLNALLGMVTVGMFGWAMARAERADPSYLAAPWKAALSWLTYLNPFKPANQPRAVFHWIAIAISLLMVRTMAVANNLAIAFELQDLLTPLSAAVAALAPSNLVYMLVVTILVAPFWLISLYMVPHLLKTAISGRPHPI